MFWSGLADGEFITDAAAAAGTHRQRGRKWLAEAGGVRPRRGHDLQGCYLTLAEREEIALARARGESMRDIARALPRDERARVGLREGVAAEAPKLATNLELRAKVEADLAKKYSPEQICGRLKHEFPHQPEMQMSTETIYQSLCNQSRGALKQDLTRSLTTGRDWPASVWR